MSDRARRALPLLMSALVGGMLAVGHAPSTACAEAPEKVPPNVLFLVSDDLRPSFGAYGGPIQTPNLDRLAGQGTTFLRAYAQVALCSPSRTSLLTGMLPDATRVMDLKRHFRQALPDVVTLPEHFRLHGYQTLGLGKVYHGGLDDPPSWSAPSWEPDLPPYGPGGPRYHQAAGEEEGGPTRGPPGLATTGPDNSLYDGALADRAITELQRLAHDRATRGTPFFLAVGFRKPHLPFVAPQSYWDLYPPDQIQLAPNPDPPQGAPAVALTDWAELRNYQGIPQTGPVTDAQARELIRGYYASASYMDAQLGRVVDALDALHLRQDTIIVFWGDHGWSLGEHGLWCKHTNFEEATHAPLILVVPGQKAPGGRANALTEFVDVYPTLAQAAGLPVPAGLAGQSVLALTDDPSLPNKDAALSQYRHKGTMGASIRTDRYRYTSWGDEGAELYDHATDPGENVNLAQDPRYADLKRELGKQLQASRRR